MATLKQFEDIEAWQKARELTHAVYSCSKVGAFARDFGLRDQIRRAAISVMSNIAEGFERGGTLEFVQFLAVAKGSTGEGNRNSMLLSTRNTLAMRNSVLFESNSSLNEEANCWFDGISPPLRD